MDFSDVVRSYNDFQSGDISALFYASASKGDDVGPGIVGLANSHGGTMIMGLDFTNHHLLGCELDDDFFRELITRHCDPMLSVSFHSIYRHNKTIVCLDVDEGHSKPYRYKGKAYVYEDGLCRLASSEEEKALGMMASQRTADPVSEEIVKTVTLPRESNQFSTALPATPTTETFQEQVDAGTNPTPFGDAISPRIETSAAAETVSAVSASSTVDAAVSEPAVPLTEANSSLDEGSLAEEKKPVFVIPKTLNKRQKRAITYLKKRPFIKNKKYRSMFDISHKTAHLELSEMVSMGLLIIQGSGRSTSYALKIEDSSELSPSDAGPNEKEVLSATTGMVAESGTVDFSNTTVAPIDTAASEEEQRLLSFPERKAFLISYLKLNGSISEAQYADLLKIPSRLAQKDLSDFVFTGEMKEHNTPSGVIFSLVSNDSARLATDFSPSVSSV